MPIAQPQAPMQANVPVVGNQVSTAPVGVGMQPSVNGEEGGPNRVSSNLAAPGQSLPNTPEERARLNPTPWINPQTNQFQELTPEQAKDLTPEQQTAYMKIAMKMNPNRRTIQPPPQANVPQTNFTVQ